MQNDPNLPDVNTGQDDSRPAEDNRPVDLGPAAEVKGGTLELPDGRKADVSGTAILKAQGGDMTQANKELEQLNIEKANLVIATAGPEQFAATSMRQACQFAENVLAYKCQEANKHPGSVIAMIRTLQDFRESFSDHPMMDRVSEI